MRMWRSWWSLGLAAFVGLAACGGDAESEGNTLSGEGGGGAGTGTGTGAGATGGGGGGQGPSVVIDIVVDANRDGVVDPADPGDQEHENEWGPQFGASFLANLDDDNADGVRDADNDVFEDGPDLSDIAIVKVNAWPGAPDGSRGSFSVDPLSAENVRVWKKGLDGLWTLVAGSVGPCAEPGTPCTIVPSVDLTVDEVRAGVDLGIEGRRFRISDDDGTWDGMVQLGFAVLDAQNVVIVSPDAPNGVDEAKIRLAPWVLFGNLSPHDTVWSSGSSTAFTAGVGKATTAAGLTYNKYKNWGDQWTQDFFQTAWTGIPGPDGTVRGMRVANARPWGRTNADKDLPIMWLRKNYLGPDRAAIEIYKKPHTGTSYDSHGNHDLLPPYKKGDQSFPLGRIIIGSGILPETKEFYAAQKAQAPYFVVDTAWLIVGHVDEFFSYAPAKTDRGWKLLVGWPKEMVEVLETKSAEGYGDAVFFEGLKRYKGNGLVPADITIDEMLADLDIMEWSQEAQVEIEANLEKAKAEIGLADDEIVFFPFLFEQDYGAKVSYDPGTVNLLAFGDYLVVPDPFGAVIDGKDMMKEILDGKLATPENKLGSKGEGMSVFYADDWYTYHILLGEVHCGTNPEAPAPFSSAKWWESGK